MVLINLAMETMIKLRFRYAFGVSTPFAKAPPRIGTHLSIRSSVSLPSHSSSSTLKVPLFLRPPIHSATASDLRKWSDWATRLASSVGTSFADSDGGPDSALLRRELRWLLEDAVESEDESTGVARLRTSVEDLYSAWKQRVGERRPFQYVVGCEHWRDLVLCVGEGVLIPRPETEAMVELVGEAVEADARLRDGGVWADLGTGSGAIAIGMARVLKGRGRVLATDLSPQALSVARYNVQRYALQDVIELRQGSWFEPLEGMEGRVAVIVSNPPYIPSSDISRLQAEVGRHEPVMALDGGVDGLDDLILLCKGTSSMLKPAGFFAFETNGEKQCKHLVEYMETETTDCFRDVKIVSDFAGIPRFVTGFRQ